MQHLKHSTELLQRLSMEDALTGLANRRGLERLLGQALASHLAHEPLFVAVVDVEAEVVGEEVQAMAIARIRAASRKTIFSAHCNCKTDFVL